MALTLIPENDPILRTKCRPVIRIDVRVIREMFELMLNSGGVGLAAPQVGIPLRFFITSWGEIFVNPTITLDSTVTDVAEEGCLSLPQRRVWVTRKSWVEVDGQLYQGLQGRVIQHEMDHLDGKLITDYT